MGKLAVRLIGGLGNQLFILAHGYKLAREQGKELVIDDSKWYAGQGEHPRTYAGALYRNFQFGTGQVVPKGYYQGLKYFEPFGDEFVSKLHFPKYKVEGTAVHIRRGDYVDSNHQVCTESYYKEAMQLCEPPFTLFSDDIEYCERAFPGHQINCSPPYLAMAYMACFDTVICSNSSFSWWASYIGGCKTIAPDRWYRNRVDTDIYRPDMICLST